ncbi:HAD-IA family hydrolase [Streptomyces ziwulingensis]|uniref:HAD family hydrolase n=1 Tax=Streptomyces ziwulingensis TaxID=1045501 RepID=A0ABP9CHJ9_9ACTN
MRQALIFDCDGVIVDVEIQRHLKAFNQVWEEAGVPWRWSDAEYERALRVSGGKERLHLLRDDPRFRAVFDVPDDPEEWRRIVAAWHRRKTQFYVASLRTGEVTARPGVRRLARDALRAGWRVAVASAGARDSVRTLVRAALGTELAAQLTLVTGESVRRKKPAPDVFDVAAASIGVVPERCVVIEDTRNGLLAATASGMTCVVTPTRLSLHDDFSEAALVISGLGDPGLPPEIVLGGPAWGCSRPCMTLDELARLSGVPGPARTGRRSLHG